ncbi:MAG: HEPN domain-containing protein [Chromatiaceae bacterium]|jgi:hypothetical protein
MVQTATAPAAAPENPTAIFDTAIADAERLLELFDKLSKPEQQANEVPKRAALVMTLTAWETFIEGWLRALINQKLGSLHNSFAGNYINKKFTEAINRLHNPDSSKVRQLSLESLKFDVTTKSSFTKNDQETVCTKLKKYLSLRSEVVHLGMSSN